MMTRVASSSSNSQFVYTFKNFFAMEIQTEHVAVTEVHSSSVCFDLEVVDLQ